MTDLNATPRTDALWQVTRNPKNPKVISYTRPPGTDAYDLSCTLERQLNACAEALKFYADEQRYKGANQNAVEGDKFTAKDAPYMQDVTRDYGAIAREALRKLEESK